MSTQTLFYLRSKPNPENDPENHLPGFETNKEAAARHAARVKLLFLGKRIPKPNLYWCKPGCPCDSGACPKCMREFRRWFVDTGITLLGQQPKPMCAATLVHPHLCCPPGALLGFDLGKAKRQLARHIERADLDALVAVGGFDFAYDQPAGRTDPYWQPHAYLIFQGVEKEIVKKALSPFYPAVSNIPRPIRTREVSDLVRALSYSMKDTYWRRSSYIDSTGRANARCLRLSKDAERELLTYLDRHRPVDRVVLKNVRREGVKLVAKR